MWQVRVDMHRVLPDDQCVRLGGGSGVFALFLFFVFENLTVD